jgi:hypothetical protein
MVDCYKPKNTYIIHMNQVYKEILKAFGSDEEIMKAIVTNNMLIYYYISKIIILNSPDYREIESGKGKIAADQVLTECIIIFRRQVKYQKAEIHSTRENLLVGKNNADLTDYLNNLLHLVIDSGSYNPGYQQSQEYEKRLINGHGFQKLYELKEIVEHTLHSCGCDDRQDKEEIFSESLIVFWKKLQNSEVSLYFTGSQTSLDKCRVFNRKFYQDSKLGTYLTGIAKNLFFNRTRSSDYKAVKNNTVEITEIGDADALNRENDNAVLLMFLYYRNFIESRKLRTIISLLQYDCNLEDKEVQKLIGINNTRIHSSRLRNHFYEWYSQNLSKLPVILDSSNEYYTQRDSKKEKLNIKIRTVDLFQKNNLKAVDLSKFLEEFNTVEEFHLFHKIFKYVIYFSSIGKPSALTGLPDEKLLRNMMEIYKNEIFKLTNYQAILLLLFYASDEPGEIIVYLLNHLHIELKEMDQHSESSLNLLQQLERYAPHDRTGLTKELYKSNRILFDNLTQEGNFNTLINTNENIPSAF